MPFTPIQESQQTGFTPATRSDAGIFSRIGDDLKRRGQNMSRMFNTFRQSQSTGLRGLAESAATGVGIVGQIAGGVGDVIGQGVISAGKAVLNQQQEDEIRGFVDSIAQSNVAQKASGAWQSFEQEHPFASAAVSGAANIIGLTGAGEVGSVAKSGLMKTVGRVGTGIASVAEKVAPKTTGVLRQGAQILKDTSSSAVGHITALSPETVKSIVQGRVSKEAMESLDRVSLAAQAREGINAALEDLSGLGSGYTKLRESGQVANIPVGGRVNIGDNVLREVPKPLTDALSEYGLSIDETGRITRGIDSRPFDPATVNKIQEFFDTYGKTGDITADQFLNVRQAADRIVNWGAGDADLANSFAKTLRSNYDRIGKAEIKGLENLDSEFAPMRQELGQIQRQFLTSRGELKDTALTSIANLTNKGREQVLARLEKHVPGITEQIHVLRAIEDVARASDLKVGAYTKGGVIAGGAIAGGPAGAMLAFLGTHPSVVVPMLRKLGEVYRAYAPQIEKIINKLRGGDALNTEERKFFINAISDSRYFQDVNKKDIGGFGSGGRRMESSFRPMGDEGRYRANLSDMGSFENKAAGTSRSLLSEAKKYKTAEEFVDAQVKRDYRSTHQIDTKTSVPLIELSDSKLDSFVEEFKRQYGHPSLKSKEVNKLKSIISNPDADVTIYRASPKNELNSGDWVTIDKDYANDIKRQNGGRVYKYTVKAGDLFYPNTLEGFRELPSLNKWGAFQYESSTTKSQLLDIWKKAHGKK